MPSDIEDRFEKHSGGLSVACNTMRRSYCKPLMAKLISWKPSDIEEPFENPSAGLRVACAIQCVEGNVADLSWSGSYRGRPLTLNKGSKPLWWTKCCVQCNAKIPHGEVHIVKALQTMKGSKNHLADLIEGCRAIQCANGHIADPSWPGLYRGSPLTLKKCSETPLVD